MFAATTTAFLVLMVGMQMPLSLAPVCPKYYRGTRGFHASESEENANYENPLVAGGVICEFPRLSFDTRQLWMSCLGCHVL